jgi:NTP pyrophosphatase (non-canonical NTP hydrolase)
MDFKEYQEKSRKTALYPNKDNNFVYPTLGLAGEAGEVSEKIKKVIRDKGGVIDDETRELIKKELGDVLWYVSQLATELELSLDDVAEHNIEKLYSRMERNVLHGDGDNR